mgnify:FL=1
MSKRSSDVRGWAHGRKRRKTTADKVAILERKVASRKPEAKHHSATATGSLATGVISYLECTYLAEGTGIGERVGSQVRLLYTEYSLSVFSATSAAYGVDLYLVTTRDGSTPVVADFLGSPGGFPDRDKYIKWKQHLTNADDNNGNLLTSYRWQYPMRVHFNGVTATDGIRNRTFLVVKNSTGSSVNYAMNERTWFTDA